MPHAARMLVRPVRSAVVLDGNDQQHCPSCGAITGLRLVAVEPHAVVWCACSRAWPYPTLTYEWLVTYNDDFPTVDGERMEWAVGEPIPPEVLERAPGLDELVRTIDDVVAGGFVDSHRRLSDDEAAEVRAQPGTGVGPGVFRVRVQRRDPDARTPE